MSNSWKSILDSRTKFHDPFVLDSNLYMPEDFYTALSFALYLAIKNPLYCQAAHRTVSYFVTDVDFSGKVGDHAERNAYREYLIDSLGLLDALLVAGTEQFIYGNSFARINFPFDRFLVDRRNGGYKLYSLNQFGDDIRFSLQEMKYTVRDPMSTLPYDQRPYESFEFIDRKAKRREDISIRFLPPMRMMLDMNWISGNTEYVYRFDEFFESAIRQGEPIHQVNETPIDMLKAIRNDQDFKFNPGAIFHFRQPFISGLSYNGWGIPNILLNYSNLHMAQVYRCINESIGKDYMLPFRLLSPTGIASQGGADVISGTNMAVWKAAMEDIIAKKRKDQTSMFTVPFPVTYQEFGASGKQLAPVELIQMQDDATLNAFGYPSEFWRMNLQFQMLPSAMRLFQSNFSYLYRSMNRFVQWVSKQVQDYLEEKQLTVRLTLPTMADDIEKRHIYLQLASGGEISRQTAYKPFGIDNPEEEAHKRMLEDIAIQKAQDRENQNFEREMTAGSANQVVDAMLQSTPEAAAPPGGGGMAGGGGIPPLDTGTDQNLTPLDIEQQAEQYAIQLLNMNDFNKRKLMDQLRNTKPTLYAVIKEKMEQIRAQGASQGRAQAGKQ